MRRLILVITIGLTLLFWSVSSANQEIIVQVFFTSGEHDYTTLYRNINGNPTLLTRDVSELHWDVTKDCQLVALTRSVTTGDEYSHWLGLGSFVGSEFKEKDFPMPEGFGRSLLFERFSPDGKYLAAVSLGSKEPSRLLLFTINDRKFPFSVSCVKVYEDKTSPYISGVRWTPNSTRFAVNVGEPGKSSGFVQYDLASGSSEIITRSVYDTDFVGTLTQVDPDTAGYGHNSSRICNS